MMTKHRTNLCTQHSLVAQHFAVLSYQFAADWVAYNKRLMKPKS